MAEVIGRAGFHAQHAKKVSERAPVLHGMMRELDEDAIDYWATRNPNIVVEDEPLNEAMVNDGNGGFQRCTDRREVLDYGAKRVGKVKRKFREDKLDPKTGKMKGGTVTISLLVAHLPKSLCVEVPDFYPVLDQKTGKPVLDNDGQPMKRSRWVARDRAEARRYFQDVIDYLSAVAIPGGKDGILGYDIQHSESTPHVQIMADTFAPDPKDEEALRVESSQYWFSHREVKDENGKQKSGPAKLRDYHAGLKRHLLGLGYDISPDFDEQRHMVGMGKDEYTRSMDAKRFVEERGSRVNEDHVKLNEWDAQLLATRHELEDLAAALDEREGVLERREMELPALRRKVRTEARAEALAAARDEIESAVEQRVVAAVLPARSAMDRQREVLEESLARSAAERQKYVAAATEFVRLSHALQPLVEKWEQANPHTDKGAKAQSMATRIRQLEQRGAEIREASPDHDHELGG